MWAWLGNRAMNTNNWWTTKIFKPSVCAPGNFVSLSVGILFSLKTRQILALKLLSHFYRKSHLQICKYLEVFTAFNRVCEKLLIIGSVRNCTHTHTQVSILYIYIYMDIAKTRTTSVMRTFFSSVGNNIHSQISQFVFRVFSENRWIFWIKSCELWSYLVSK